MAINRYMLHAHTPKTHINCLEHYANTTHIFAFSYLKTSIRFLLEKKTSIIFVYENKALSMIVVRISMYAEPTGFFFTTNHDQGRAALIIF